MMSKHKYFVGRYLLLFFGMAVIVSCTKNFTEYNTNPNEATEEMTNWDNVRSGSFFLQMEKNVLVIAQSSDDGSIGSDRYQTVEVMGGDGFVGYFGFASPSINSAGRYNWQTASWYGDMFTTNYKKTMNAWRALRASINDDTDPRFSLAQIVKVAAMHRVTDTYGPIPYVYFGDSSMVNYDSQKNVYYKFFDELDAAISNLEPYANSGETILSSWDCVYKGNVKSWVKFANTLRLRLAMHIAYADPAKAQAEAEAAVSNSIGLMLSATDIAKLQHIYPIATYESPLYIINGWDDVNLGATLESYMKGYQDPRLAVYFTKGSDGSYHGIRAGMSGSIAKSNYTTGLFSEPNVNATSDVVWMRASESYFLLAEGALRGWNMGGTAKSFYEAGIAMSFTENSVADASYITNSTAVPVKYTDPVTTGYSMDARGTITIAWNDAADFETNLERIITQKYIALFPVGQEAWTEFRRTGYPKVFPVAVNESNGGCVDTETQIRRLSYPVLEYNTNADVLAGGIQLLGGPDNPGTKLWWDAK
jgi:hypothetical protein